MIYGSIPAARWLRARIEAALAGGPYAGRVYPGRLLPPDAPLPAIQVYREAATDGRGPVGTDIPRETLRYTVKAVGEGQDEESLLPLAEALHRAIHGQRGTQDGHRIEVDRQGELPFGDLLDNNHPYVQLGGVYAVDVTD